MPQSGRFEPAELKDFQYAVDKFTKTLEKLEDLLKRKTFVLGEETKAEIEKKVIIEAVINELKEFQFQIYFTSELLKELGVVNDDVFRKMKEVIENAVNTMKSFIEEKQKEIKTIEHLKREVGDFISQIKKQKVEYGDVIRQNISSTTKLTETQKEAKNSFKEFVEGFKGVLVPIFRMAPPGILPGQISEFLWSLMAIGGAHPIITILTLLAPFIQELLRYLLIRRFEMARELREGLTIPGAFIPGDVGAYTRIYRQLDALIRNTTEGTLTIKDIFRVVQDIKTTSALAVPMYLGGPTFAGFMASLAKLIEIKEELGKMHQSLKWYFEGLTIEMVFPETMLSIFLRRDKSREDLTEIQKEQILVLKPLIEWYLKLSSTLKDLEKTSNSQIELLDKLGIKTEKLSDDLVKTFSEIPSNFEKILEITGSDFKNRIIGIVRDFEKGKTRIEDATNSIINILIEFALTHKNATEKMLKSFKDFMEKSIKDIEPTIERHNALLSLYTLVLIRLSSITNISINSLANFSAQLWRLGQVTDMTTGALNVGALSYINTLEELGFTSEEYISSIVNTIKTLRFFGVNLETVIGLTILFKEPLKHMIYSIEELASTIEKLYRPNLNAAALAYVYLRKNIDSVSDDLRKVIEKGPIASMTLFAYYLDASGEELVKLAKRYGMSTEEMRRAIEEAKRKLPELPFSIVDWLIPQKDSLQLFMQHQLIPNLFGLNMATAQQRAVLEDAIASTKNLDKALKDGTEILNRYKERIEELVNKYKYFGTVVEQVQSGVAGVLAKMQGIKEINIQDVKNISIQKLLQLNFKEEIKPPSQSQQPPPPTQPPTPVIGGEGGREKK